MSNEYDPGQAPTATFPAVPGPAQPRQEYVRLHEDGTARPAADNPQPDGTPRYTSNGFTQAERSARAAGQKGNLRNYFLTGDSKLDPDSEQGKALAPSQADPLSVASLILAFFIPIAGFITGLMAFDEAKKNQRRVHGSAITGVVIGGLGTIAWTLFWIVTIFVMVSAANAVNSYPYGG
jgi:hypothetical protein